MILNILFIAAGLFLFLFYEDMFYLHISAISLMIVTLIKCYYRGLKNGFIWLGLVIFFLAMFMLKDKTLTINEFSKILLILGPGITVGILAAKQRKYVEQLKEAYTSTLRTLAQATDARDSYTQGHSERVARYAVSIAKEMELPIDEINYLEQAALLHDIGKIAVPDKILHKKEPLDENEWSIIRKHPEHSRRILSNLSFLTRILPTVIYHHKRFDDNTYLFGKVSRKDILASRILAVADAFDAMTSDRPYRDKMDIKQALAELEKCSGSQFDPKVIDAFKKTYSEEGL